AGSAATFFAAFFTAFVAGLTAAFAFFTGASTSLPPALAPTAPPTTAPTAAPSGPRNDPAAAPAAAPPTIPISESSPPVVFFTFAMSRLRLDDDVGCSDCQHLWHFSCRNRKVVGHNTQPDDGEWSETRDRPQGTRDR